MTLANRTQLFSIILFVLATTFVSARSELRPLDQIDNIEDKSEENIVPHEGWLPMRYACDNGNYAPACEKVNSKTTWYIDVTQSPLANWYACQNGNYESACAIANGKSSFNFDITNSPLANWYACQNGNYESACAIANGELSIRFDITESPLANWYACQNGNYEPACAITNYH